jgi:hypothetical protein
MVMQDVRLEKNCEQLMLHNTSATNVVYLACSNSYRVSVRPQQLLQDSTARYSATPTRFAISCGWLLLPTLQTRTRRWVAGAVFAFVGVSSETIGLCVVLACSKIAQSRVIHNDALRRTIVGGSTSVLLDFVNPVSALMRQRSSTISQQVILVAQS